MYRDPTKNLQISMSEKEDQSIKQGLNPLHSVSHTRAPTTTPPLLSLLSIIIPPPPFIDKP